MANLFEAAAERNAIASGLPVSQELLRVRGIDAPAAGPLFEEYGNRFCAQCDADLIGNDPHAPGCPLDALEVEYV
jgi:hypothetical protein